MILTDYLANVAAVLEDVIAMIGDIIGVFTGNPVLLTFLALAVIGALFGIVQGLVRGA